MTKKILILAIGLFTTYSFSQKKWTLKECIHHALQNNLNIKQNRLNIQASEANLKDSKGNFLPTLNASTGGNFSFNPIVVNNKRTGTNSSFSGSIGLNSGITLYAGGRNKNLLKQSKLAIEKNKLNLSVIENNTTIQIVNGYLNILFAKENLNVAKTQYEISQNQTKRAKAQFEAEIIPKLDFLNTQATEARDLQNVIAQENNLNLSILNLAQALQISTENFDIANIDVTIPKSALVYKDVREVFEKAMSYRPEIANAKLDIKNAKISTAIAKSSYLPSVSASASANSGYGYGLDSNAMNQQFGNQINNSFRYGAGVSVNIPIFNGFKNDARVQRAKIQENITEIALENQKLQLEQTIQKAYLDAKVAIKTYEAAQVSLKAQEESFKNAQESYNYGVMTLYDFDQVRNRLVNAQATAIRAKYDYIFKIKVLKFFYGDSIAE